MTVLKDGKKEILSFDNFEIKGNEFILDIFIPQSDENTFVRAYKHSRRDTTSRNIVTGVCRVKVVEGKVEESKFVFSGIADRPKE